MKALEEMSREELLQEKQELLQAYEDYQKRGLKLNMARGKPSLEQLNLSLSMMDVMNSYNGMAAENGTDCRNYGELEGIEEARRLIAEIMDTTPDHVICFGNSSLNVMYDMVARAWSHGVCGSTPWGKLPEVKFLCPVPGYDRHFAITEFFGIEMINIPMTETGPDMDLVEKYVNTDPAVKGIWCVPKFTNPEGIVYSDETVRRFARLTPAAEDFRIFWDNAYSVHYLYEDCKPQIPDLVKECEIAGHPDMVYKFASTSKITFPGSGISGMAVSKKNRDSILEMMKIQTIGPDKVNQLRHVRFLKNAEGVAAQMKKHGHPAAEIRDGGAGAGTGFGEPRDRFLPETPGRLLYRLSCATGHREADHFSGEGLRRDHDRSGSAVPLRKGSGGFRDPDRTVVSAAG